MFNIVNIGKNIGKKAFGALSDNVVDFADVKRQQLRKQIKGAMQNVPYMMNLPYEMGQKLNAEGKLPLPLGTKLLPIGGKGRPDEVHQIVGYKADIYNPEIYGYEVRSPDGEISFEAISNPVTGLKQTRPDRVGSFTAALGPDGLENMPFVPPQRRVMTAPEKPTYTQEEQAEIDKFYDDMFGDPD
tara:strand:+ start:232 stop:789 length:558 start_codon:yes stop_codon:yes gene_type:complete